MREYPRLLRFELIKIRHLSNFLLFKTVVIIFITALPLSSLSLAQSCDDVFKNNPAVFKLIFSDKDLMPSENYSPEPTVDFQSLMSDGSVLLKKTKENWKSNYDYLNQATLQGDPRFPIFIFGVKLAYKMGFQIGKDSDGFVYMTVPGALKLEKWIRKMNSLLQKRNYESISYMPIKTDFVTSAQALELATKNDKDIKLFFPFADNNKKLTVHEITFHLGAILFPKNFIERGHDVSVRTLQFIDYLKLKKQELGPVVEKIIEQMIIDRGYENDAGTANLVWNLALIRELNPLLSYSKIAPSLLPMKDTFTVRNLTEAVDFYARPSFSPLSAVITSLHLMTGVDTTKLGAFSYNKNIKFNFNSHPRSNINRSVILSKVELDKLRKILIDFVNLHKDEETQRNYQLFTPEELLQSIVQGFDTRIDQLLEIAEAMDQLP